MLSTHNDSLAIHSRNSVYDLLLEILLNLVIHKSEETKIFLSFNDVTEQFHSFLALEESAWAKNVLFMSGDIQILQSCHFLVENRREN